MPITCAIQFEPLSTEAFGSLDYAVMAHAFASHQDLGCLADEYVYQSDFAERLVSAGFAVAREVEVTVAFEAYQKYYFLDLVINGLAVYELKTVSKLLKQHSSQLLNYLLILDRERGKLINFRPMSVESEFVNAPLSGQDRRRFTIEKALWHGPDRIMAFAQALIADWGTGLELPLYRQGLIHLLGGEELVTVMLPMTRVGHSIGNQRFNLADEYSAFGLTAFSNSPIGYPSQLLRLLQCSPLQSFHWINIAHHQLTFSSIAR